MAENNGLMKAGDDNLLDVFVSEEDQQGMDILSMSDFFSVFIGKIENKMNSDTTWEVPQNIEGIVGEIAAAIKGSVDISQMGMLVADSSHFSQDIVDKIKAGIYHVGQSKEVAGNLRPAIIGEKGQLIKFFTLKKALNPSIILSDISMLSMQASLQRISAQLEDIGRDVRSVIDFSRREALSSKFIYARDRIMLASTAEGEKRTALLEEADTYLNEGLSDLYQDIHAQVKELEGQKKKGLVASIKTIDKILSFISEDMQMIPRYVALRVYIFNYQNRAKDANRVLKDYRYQLQSLAEKKLGTGKYSAFELVHTYYPYDDKNVDFWLENPRQMLRAIDNFQLMLEQKDKEVYYIDSEAEHGRDYN